MKPITTYYSDHKFRSRLEARWAVFFNEIGLKWVYEMEGYVLKGGTTYLPDFFFPELQCFGEVKPENYTQKERNKVMEFGKYARILLLSGLPSNSKKEFFSPDYEESSYKMQFFRDRMIENGKTVWYWRFWWSNDGQIDHDNMFVKQSIIAKQMTFEFKNEANVIIPRPEFESRYQRVEIISE